MERAYKDLLTVLRECQANGHIIECGRGNGHIQSKIEAIHATLDAALPSENTSEADIREWVWDWE